MIRSSARRIVEALDLDPGHVERMESAALHGDQADLERAVADMQEAIAAAS